MDKKKVFLIGLVCLILIYLDLRYLLKWQFSALSGTNKKITDLKRQIASLKQNLESIQDLRNKKSQLSVEKKKVLTQDQLPSLLENISVLANKHNVKIIQMRPLKPAADNKKTPAVNFSPLELDLDLSAGYHQLGSFISDLEESRELMEVKEFRISSDPADVAHQKVDLTLRVYIER